MRIRSQDDAVDEGIAELKSKFRGLKVIVGRDKIDGVKGVKQKLQGYERFLVEHPEWLGKVVLVQIASVGAGTTEASTNAVALAGRINSRFGNLVCDIRGSPAL